MNKELDNELLKKADALDLTVLDARKEALTVVCGWNGDCDTKEPQL